VTVPIYETSSAEQVRFVLQDSGAVLIFAETDEHADKIEHLESELTELRKVLRIEGSVTPALDALGEAGKSVDPKELDDRLAGISSADPATLIYTSGTTGRPKGCQLTHSNLLYEIRGAKACFPTLLAKGERMLVFLPLAHVLARAITVACFTNKVTLGFTSDIKNLVPTFGVFKPTLVVSVPRVFEKVYNTAEQNARNDGKGPIFERAVNTAIEYSQAHDSGGAGLLLRAKHALFDKLVYGKLRAALGGRATHAVSGGASLGTRLIHFFHGIGLEVLEGYGLTETTAAITLNPIGKIRPGTVGLPVPGAAVRIAEDGEVQVRGPMVFSGYWHNDTATAEAIVDGWFSTGDLGSLDGDGYLSITGRKKEILVTAGGKNVAPAVLEDRINAHPLVNLSMVVGDKQPYIAALLTIDPEALPHWLANHSKPLGMSLAAAAADPDLRAELQRAIDEANKAVSHAEAIKRFTVLGAEWTVEGGQVTPSMKLKRNVVMAEHTADVAELYTGSKAAV
jgi:long-chain acyl-CoA synthetase